MKERQFTSEEAGRWNRMRTRIAAGETVEPITGTSLGEHQVSPLLIHNWPKRLPILGPSLRHEQ